VQPKKNEKFMKKSKSELNDWMRPSYKRSDFKKIERGKYAARMRAATNVIVLDPEVAKVFPNNEAVNKALRGLIDVARASAKSERRARS
jgi:hypothetical protein